MRERVGLGRTWAPHAATRLGARRGTGDRRYDRRAASEQTGVARVAMRASSAGIPQILRAYFVRFAVPSAALSIAHTTAPSAVRPCLQQVRCRPLFQPGISHAFGHSTPSVAPPTARPTTLSTGQSAMPSAVLSVAHTGQCYTTGAAGCQPYSTAEPSATLSPVLSARYQPCLWSSYAVSCSTNHPTNYPIDCPVRHAIGLAVNISDELSSRISPDL